MCILIVKPAGKSITKEIFQRCFTANPDGAGFAYVNTDNHGKTKVKVKKSMTFNKFWTQYERAVREAPESNMVIHFRIKTSGTIEEYNNHPFNVTDDLVIAHNGIISNMNKRLQGRENDTRAFIRIILRNLPDGWQNNSGCIELIEDYIGWSKLATLDTDNNVVIMNEEKGNWDEEVWYSNTSYKPVGQLFGQGSRQRQSTNTNSSSSVSPNVWSWRTGKHIPRKDAQWNSTAKDWELKTPVTNVYQMMKDQHDLNDGTDSADILDLGDLTPNLAGDGCEYCETRQKGLSYRKYRSLGVDMIFCSECANMLEDAKIIKSDQLVSSVIANA